MRAGTNAGVVAIPPVQQIVAAFVSGAGMIGDFIARQARRFADLLGELIEVSSGVFVRQDQLSLTVQ